MRAGWVMERRWRGNGRRRGSQDDLAPSRSRGRREGERREKDTLGNALSISKLIPLDHLPELEDGVLLGGRGVVDWDVDNLFVGKRREPSETGRESKRKKGAWGVV